jgi:hypothetical protein
MKTTCLKCSGLMVSEKVLAVKTIES